MCCVTLHAFSFDAKLLYLSVYLFYKSNFKVPVSRSDCELFVGVQFYWILSLCHLCRSVIRAMQMSAHCLHFVSAV